MAKNTRIIFAVIASSILALAVGLLANIAAGYLAPQFAERPWIVWLALGVTFLLSLPLSVYLFLRGSGDPAHKDAGDRQGPTVDTTPLPPRPYLQFFGREPIIEEVLGALRDPSGKWAVGIDGMGGIGKTSLARVVVDRSLEEKLFEVVIWEPRPAGISFGTTAPLSWPDIFAAIGRQLGAPDLQGLPESERIPRLGTLLNQHKALLVLDNLESAIHSQDEVVTRLLPLLQHSKAILTSRRRFKGDLYAVHLKGLNDESAMLLIRSEAQQKGIQRVAEAESGELLLVTHATGGSPLAIKLTVGQLQHLPLEQVLRSLAEVGGEPTGDADDEYVRFYKGIFWNSWNLLSEDAQRLLIAMAVFAPGIGGTFDAIQSTSGIDQSLLTRKIDELWRLSFLEVGQSTLQNTRYYLHPLTQYFVVSDIVNSPK